MISNTPQLILASGSPQRRRLLAEAGYEFEVTVPDECEPDVKDFSDPVSYVAHASWLKARQVVAQVTAGIVLAADTVVACGGEVIGKPSDREHARNILLALSGTRHQVLTGVCVWRQPEGYWLGGVEVTQIQMRRLEHAVIESYLDSNRWVGKAGAYAIQDPDPYVSIVSGSHSNVVGLPMELVARLIGRST